MQLGYTHFPALETVSCFFIWFLIDSFRYLWVQLSKVFSLFLQLTWRGQQNSISIDRWRSLFNTTVKVIFILIFHRYVQLLLKFAGQFPSVTSSSLVYYKNLRPYTEMCLLLDLLQQMDWTKQSPFISRICVKEIYRPYLMLFGFEVVL